MNAAEFQQTLDGLRRENRELHRIIARARGYSGKEGWTCPLCSYEHGIAVIRCALHARLHETFEQMIAAYRMLCAGDIDGARQLLDTTTRYHRAPEID